MIAKQLVIAFLLLSLVGVTALRAEEPVDRAKLLTTLMKREVESWELLKEGNAKDMGAFYPEDLVMISGDSSRYNKKEFLKSLKDFTLNKYEIKKNPEIVVLTPEAATIVYQVTYTLEFTDKEKKPKTVTMLSSSTYALRNKQWMLVFNQETPVPEK